MLLVNTLTLAVGITTVSCRSIGDIIPTLRLPTPLSPSTDASTPQCAFLPHQPPQNTASSSSIPSHAWAHISTLLTTHSPLTTARSRVQTLRISELSGDSSLEGIVLGLVYTVPEPAASEKELRDLKGGIGKGEQVEKEEADLLCLKDAVKIVEEKKQMEGVLEVQGKGRVGFLVYRVD